MTCALFSVYFSNWSGSLNCSAVKAAMVYIRHGQVVFSLDQCSGKHLSGIRPTMFKII